jgi:hypothetical protein
MKDISKDQHLCEEHCKNKASACYCCEKNNDYSCDLIEIEPIMAPSLPQWKMDQMKKVGEYLVMMAGINKELMSEQD